MDEKIRKLLENAAELQKKAEAEFQRDHREAAEKAWGATRAAAEALHLKVEGGGIPEDMGRTMRRLAERLGRPEIWEHFRRAMRELHGSCFYGGVCDPPEDEKLVRGTKRYIELVRELVEK